MHPGKNSKNHLISPRNRTPHYNGINQAGHLFLHSYTITSSPSLKKTQLDLYTVQRERKREEHKFPFFYVVYFHHERFSKPPSPSLPYRRHHDHHPLCPLRSSNNISITFRTSQVTEKANNLSPAFLTSPPSSDEHLLLLLSTFNKLVEL